MKDIKVRTSFPPRPSTPKYFIYSDRQAAVIHCFIHEYWICEVGPINILATKGGKEIVESGCKGSFTGSVRGACHSHLFLLAVVLYEVWETWNEDITFPKSTVCQDWDSNPDIGRPLSLRLLPFFPVHCCITTNCIAHVWTCRYTW